MSAAAGTPEPASRAPEPSFVSRLLRQEVVPSFGCTEPAALALAAAAASAAAAGEPREIHLRADLGTYKNALAVGLPGTLERGPRIAAAAGALIARPELRLGILAAADEATWRRAAEWVRAGVVTIDADPEARGVRVRATVRAATNEGGATLEGRHDRLTSRSRNGVVLPAAADSPDGGTTDATRTEEISDAEIRRSLASAKDLLRCLDQLGDPDRHFLLTGVETNRALAECAFDGHIGLGAGKGFRRLHGATGDLGATIKSWVAAGVEARMAGASMPAMTSGGSGNSGLTVILGSWAAAEALGPFSSDRFTDALALAHLVNVAIKARIGRVGPLCGGAIASSTAVACAITLLLGGDEAALDRVIRHMVGTVAGTVCDGAGPTCALKIAGGLGVALDAARLAIGGGGSVGPDGLAGADAAAAFEALHRLASNAYAGTDRAVTAILTSR